MKRTVFIITILLIAVGMTNGQTITQKGVAYRYNGKQQRKPLGNVTISYSNNQRSTLSNEQNGEFTLTLSGLKMGDPIGFVEVKKREMMVFNQHAVKEWSIRKEPLMLVLCNADEFERQKENLINIGKREAKKKYDRQKAELEAKLNASQMKQQEYEAALDKAYDELERFQKNVGEYADLFARIDESEVDTLAQRALDMFNQGKVEEAIRLFEQGHYMEKLDKALKNSQQADQLKAVAEHVKEQATQDSLKALQSLKAQIEAYKMNNEWNKTGELLKGLADRLNTVNEKWDYAEFCVNQLNYTEAEDYLKQTLVLVEKLNGTDKNNIHYHKTKIDALYRLATIYMSTDRFAESEKLFNEAIDLCKQLAFNNPQKYDYELALALYGISNLYHITLRDEESKQYFKKALDVSYKSEDDFRCALFFINAINKFPGIWLNRLLMYDELLEKAQIIYKQAISHRTQIPEDQFAQLLISLADFYLKEGWYFLKKEEQMQLFQQCEKMYEEAIDSYRILVKKEQWHKPNLAYSIASLGFFYSNIKKTNLISSERYESLLLEAYYLYKELYVDNPKAYKSVIANIAEEIAFACLGDSLRYKSSETFYLESIKIYQELSTTNPDIYEKELARTTRGLAFLYQAEKRFSESEKAYLEALDIFKRLAIGNPQPYLSNVENIMEEILVLYEKWGNHTKEQENIIKEIRSIYIELGHLTEQTKYIENLFSVFNWYEELLINENRIEDIYKFLVELYPHLVNNLSEALNINEDLSSLHSDYWERKSYYEILLKKYSEAEKSARSGLEITPTGNLTFLNLVAALIFQGKFLEVKDLYIKKKDVFSSSFLDVLKELGEHDAIPSASEISVAWTLDKLAGLYSYNDYFSESEAMYNKALETYRIFVSDKSQVYEPDLAMTLFDLAILYYDDQQFRKSEAKYKEALEIYRKLATDTPAKYEPNVAMTLYNLAILYYDDHQYKKSEAKYKEALEIYRKLATDTPAEYEPNVAMTLYRLAFQYEKSQQFQDSEAMYKEALEICRRLAVDNPQIHEPKVVYILTNLANFYANTQRYEESEAMYLEAIGICQYLTTGNIEVYGLDLVSILNHLAILYINIQRPEKSEAKYKEALDICHRLALVNPQIYEHNVAVTLNNLASLYHNTQRFKESEAMYKEALEIYHRLAAVNPYAFDSYKSQTLRGLSSNFLFTKRYAEAEKYARESLKVYDEQHLVYTNLAAALLLQGKYTEAEKFYNLYKDELKDNFLDDFKKFAEAGIIPEKRKEDVERIKRILTQ